MPNKKIKIKNLLTTINSLKEEIDTKNKELKKKKEKLRLIIKNNHQYASEVPSEYHPDTETIENRSDILDL